ncbi:hypothetical protein THASP1DRAFT_32528 [Thamnocephalis sphaerospora]|uniref:DASH complex subunit DAD2 n=1 Tax=Thamnocephalis sphaerospora TaxID=78915 RepID=A0A4P9XIT2_9FUNG|nr:hypothetical protein THASP1DRAFT_32528 [Thamnocephalis sphaerospora]|eukprot:RKP05633.1 hypothetical protein THASP1DRAFT_32528 [Thamnocephalis sphaerospora]
MSTFPRQRGGQQLSLQQQLEEKQRELQGLLAVRDLSHNLHSYLDAMCERLDELNDGYDGKSLTVASGSSVSRVMCNWQHVFRAMSLVDTQKDLRQIQAEEQANAETAMLEDEETANAEAEAERQRLVAAAQLVLLPLHGQTGVSGGVVDSTMTIDR